MAKHIDGLTGKVFATEAEYLAHVSPVTGFTPKDLEHQGTVGIEVAKASLARTKKLTKAQETEIGTKLETVKVSNTDQKLMEAKK